MTPIAALRRRVRRLERSRDQWKQRVAAKQRHIRALRVRDLAASRDLWKSRAAAAGDPAAVLLPLPAAEVPPPGEA